jgi:hypothetical protein
MRPLGRCTKDEPSDLRANIPAGTGKLSLDDVVAHYAVLARSVSDVDKPILISHSLRGLIARS